MDRQQGWHMANAEETTLDQLIAQIDTTSDSDCPASATVALPSPSYSYNTNYSTIPASISITSGTIGQNTIRATNPGGYTIGQGNTQPSNNIHIKGKDADLIINDKSMRTWMEKVEERLNILTPNPELEKEWDQLRRLGERYRKLEQKCKEKSDAWNKLKNMPKPEIKL